MSDDNNKIHDAGEASQAAVAPPATPPTNPPAAPPAPAVLASTGEIEWVVDAPAVENYPKLGARLAAGGDLYRPSDHESGLLLAPPGPGAPHRLVLSAAELDPVILDRVRVAVFKDGKYKGSHLPPVVNALRQAANTAVLNVENARLGRGNQTGVPDARAKPPHIT